MVSGCGGAPASPSTGMSASDSKTSAAAAAPSGETPTLKLYTIAFGDTSEAPLVSAEISKLTREKIGANVELNFINFGAWQDQVNLMLSSGEHIDL
jgi:putative aldouronate transport system substrate-binding protein